MQRRNIHLVGQFQSEQINFDFYALQYGSNISLKNNLTSEINKVGILGLNTLYTLLLLAEQLHG